MTLPSIGDVVDEKFRIERKLGEGGTSSIYEVRHAITDKRFAIKWLAPELAQNEQAVQLFIHEAKVCGRLEHPNAVQIYDICRNRDSYYLLMELLEGESLEARLSRVQRLSPRAACDILLPCTEALSAAHRLGIVHRDLKPSNIFLCNVEGRAEELPKVLDFGISKLSYKRVEQGALTAAQPISGTPLYMAPEQMRGHPPDPRFDIYALGVVLYELVAGQPPFDCENLEELAVKIRQTEPAPLDQLAPVEPAFAEVVARAMAREVEDRYATMSELAHALRPYASPRPSPSSPALEARRSDAPMPAERRSMKTTRLGVWAAVPEPAAALDPAPEPSEVQAEAQVPCEAEPAEAREVGLAEPSSDIPLIEAEPSSDIPLIEAEPSSDIPLIEAESSSDIPLIEAEPEPESEPVEPLAAATESGPRRRVAAGAIALPPAAAIVVRRPGPPLRAAARRSELDELDDVVLASLHRSRGKRWLGGAIALGGALLTWYALTRTPRTPPPAVTSATPARSAPAEAETTELRAAPATADVSIRGTLEGIERVQPRHTQAPKSVVKPPPEPPRTKLAHRTNKPKRSAVSKETPGPAKREIATREPSGQAVQGLSMPSAELSRQDF
jgi:serine/threonine protein kinase